MPIVTCDPSRSGQSIGIDPHVLTSPWFQTCMTGTVSRPLATSLSTSLSMFARSGCTRAATAAARAGSVSSVHTPCENADASASWLTTLASATKPASGLPSSCIDHATEKVPTDPALPPCRNVFVVG